MLNNLLVFFVPSWLPIHLLVFVPLLIISCTVNSSDIAEGNCEPGDNYENTLLQGLFNVVDTNVHYSGDPYKYKIKLLSAPLSFKPTDGKTYYTNDINGIYFGLQKGDTLNLKCIEFCHEEGSCGPQIDSVHFFFTAIELLPSVRRDSVLIGTWKGDWYKGDRIEIIKFNHSDYVRRNHYEDGSYIDHPLHKIDSSHATCYVKLDEDRLEYYRILDDGSLGFFSSYIMFDSEDAIDNNHWRN